MGSVGSGAARFHGTAAAAVPQPWKRPLGLPSEQKVARRRLSALRVLGQAVEVCLPCRRESVKERERAADAKVQGPAMKRGGDPKDSPARPPGVGPGTEP